jgi:hypothetical protein
MSKARIQQPAPQFRGQAVMPDGQFEGKIIIIDSAEIAVLGTIR